MRFTSPREIQDFLDAIAYSSDPIYRSPARVAVDRRAHCVDGALFAAAALRRLGEPPRVLDMRAHRDDDHVIALFQRRGRWGAVAKSNVVGLRYREPVYLSLRELVMSYFEVYYNLEGERSLRSYSDPVDLSAFDAIAWETEDDRIEPVIVAALDAAPHHELMSAEMIAELTPLDRRSFDAGLLGSDAAGLYKPS
ncbi:MAG: hypothetical protein R3B09_04575 [Nannocystaceae bacterium]